ncbi:MAG: hypothetical protein ABH878_03130, partial [bacterium]
QTPEFVSQESSRSNYLKDPNSGEPMPVYPQTFTGEEEGENTTGNPPPGGISVFTDVQQVKVVPNPYRGSSLFEARYENLIRFINLPPACKITILTVAGDIVQTLDHDNGTDTESWDLLSKNTQAVVSGLYLFVAEMSSYSFVAESGLYKGFKANIDLDKKIGKFVIAR